MNGPVRSCVSVKFSPVGRTYSFLLPELALDAPVEAPPQDGAEAAPHTAPPSPATGLAPGDQVVVQTAEGRAFGTVARSVAATAARKLPEGTDSRIVRRATREDVVTRLKHQQREQEAHRI